jgi:hypothetical protein
VLLINEMEIIRNCIKYYNNKAILCHIIKDADYISEEIRNSCSERLTFRPTYVLVLQSFYIINKEKLHVRTALLKV